MSLFLPLVEIYEFGKYHHKAQKTYESPNFEYEGHQDQYKGIIITKNVMKGFKNKRWIDIKLGQVLSSKEEYEENKGDCRKLGNFISNKI